MRARQGRWSSPPPTFRQTVGEAAGHRVRQDRTSGEWSKTTIPITASIAPQRLNDQVGRWRSEPFVEYGDADQHTADRFERVDDRRASLRENRTGTSSGRE
jgi:hypothetical protein